jgi:hypothetical protein
LNCHSHRAGELQSPELANAQLTHDVEIIFNRRTTFERWKRWSCHRSTCRRTQSHERRHRGRPGFTRHFGKPSSIVAVGPRDSAFRSMPEIRASTVPP